MTLPDPQLTRSDVLKIFDREQTYLLLGAGIMTVGLIATAFSLLRRKLDPLLLWFAVFAALYGLHLILDRQPLWSLGLRPPVFLRFVVAIAYLVPIPAFMFFQRLGVIGRTGRIVSIVASPIAFCMALGTLIVGPRDLFQITYQIVVLIALLAIAIALVCIRQTSADIKLIRGGLLLFVACALYNTVTELFGSFSNIEPFSFIVLLGCLGVVAGRRTLAQEQQLSIIQKELEIACRIQLSILPVEFPASVNFQVAARYLPMTSVAGDFYDFLIGNDQQAGILIADVSGHGVPAALIASMVKLAAAGQLPNAEQPSQLLGGMNAVLCGNTQSQFVTAAYVYLDASAKEMRYSAAAHPPMLLLRNGKVSEIAENGLMLAAFSFAAYTTVSHPLERGDRMLLYTDGILEAANAAGEEFGGGRLSQLLQETAGLAHLETADRIIASVQQWSASQNDDLTVLVCDYARPA